MSRGRWGQTRWEPGRHKARMEHARAVQAQHASMGGDAGSSNAPERGRGDPKPSNQAVVKIIGWSKGSGAPARQAAYVGRHTQKEQEKGREEVPIYNEKGQELRNADRVQDEVASWQLIPPSENRSAAWDKATPEQRATMLEPEALARRQSVHIIFSLPSGARHDQVRDSAEATLSKHFGEAGYRYLYAVHTDHGRPHVHAIVKTQPETGHATSLRLGPADLDHLRRDFAHEARSRGLDVEATRRVERPELVKAIARGDEPLRNNYRKQDLLPGQPLPDKEQPDAGKVARFKRLFQKPDGFVPSTDPRKDAVAYDRQVKAIERLRAEFRKAYVNPHTAESAFKRAYDANPRQAVWTVTNRPNHFGATRPDAAPPAVTGRGLPRSQPHDTLTPEARAAAAASARGRDQAKHAADPARLVRAASRVARDLEKGGEAGRQAATAVRRAAATHSQAQPEKNRGRTIQPSRNNTRDIGPER